MPTLPGTPHGGSTGGVTQQRSGDAPMFVSMVDLRRPFQVPLCSGCNREKWTEYVLRTTCPWLCRLLSCPSRAVTPATVVLSIRDSKQPGSPRLGSLSPQLTMYSPWTMTFSAHPTAVRVFCSQSITKPGTAGQFDRGKPSQWRSLRLFSARRACLGLSATPGSGSGSSGSGPGGA